MKIKKAATALALASVLIATSAPAFAQDASPSPTATPTPSPSESASPSPSPSASPASSPDVGGTTKEEVLGETTALGETSKEREIAKWVIASIIGIGSFLLVIKTAKSAQE